MGLGEEVFVALYDYIGRVQDAQLSFREGDELVIIDKHGGDWWYGRDAQGAEVRSVWDVESHPRTFC